MAPAGSVRFEGRYVGGFEKSSFLTYGASQEFWWVDPAAMTGLPALEPGARGEVDAYVVVVGWLSVPGAYGHLGSYHRELRVHQILAAAPYDAKRHNIPPAPRIGRPSPWIDEHVPTVDVGRLSAFLVGTAHPRAAELVAPKEDVVLILNTLQSLHPEARTAFLRPNAATNRHYVFDALRFGFGDLAGRDPLEWDAMAERLAAIRRGSAGPLVVAILDAEELMLREPDEFEEAVRRLRDSADDGGGAPLHVLFHTTERFGSILRSRLDRCGDEVPRLDAVRAVTDDIAALHPDVHRQRTELARRAREGPSTPTLPTTPPPPPTRPVDGVIYDSAPMIEYQRAAFADGAASADEAASAEAAIVALDSFRPDVLIPLDFGVTVACRDEAGEGDHDPDRRPAEWHRYLVTRDLPDDLAVRPIYRDATVVEVDTVDADAMRAAVTRILDQSCEHRPNTSLAWTEMYIAAAWLPLPEPERLGDREILFLDDLDGRRLALDIPLVSRDGRLWVGPLGSVGSVPVEIQVYNDGGQLQLRIWVRWSLWWKQDGPGRRAIDAVLERLRGDGWRPR